MAIEAIRGWFGTQEQAHKVFFHQFGFQIPAETKDFNGSGIDIKLWLFEEFRAIREDKTNGFSDGCEI
jgi:hypothetical protein